LQLHLESALLPVPEFVFTGHSEHGAGPGLDLKVPAKQNAHGPPSGPEEPAGHCTEHWAGDVLPGWEVVPKGHEKHATSVMALNLLDSHIVQDPPAGPIYPASHVHAVEVVLCSGELEFAGHLLQAAAPVPALYVPMMHAVHVPHSSPENPALQVHFVTMLLPTGESECAGQLSQLAFPRPAL